MPRPLRNLPNSKDTENLGRGKREKGKDCAEQAQRAKGQADLQGTTQKTFKEEKIVKGVLIGIAVIFVALITFVIWCCCKVSGDCTRDEEENDE